MRAGEINPLISPGFMRSNLEKTWKILGELGAGAEETSVCHVLPAEEEQFSSLT